VTLAIGERLPDLGLSDGDGRAVALFDAEGCLAWLQPAATLGDYPRIPDLLAVLRQAARAAPWRTALARLAGAV